MDCRRQLTHNGFLIPPIALYFVGERRADLAAAPIKPSWFGLVVFAGGILLLLAGLLGSELFITRISAARHAGRYHLVPEVSAGTTFFVSWRFRLRSCC